MAERNLVAELLQKVQGEPNALRFPDEALRQTTADLQKLQHGETLFNLMQDLIALAGIIRENYRSEKAARQILELADGLVPRLEELAALDVSRQRKKSTRLRERLAQEKKALQNAPGTGAAFKGKSGKSVTLRKTRGPLKK